MILNVKVINTFFVYIYFLFLIFKYRLIFCYIFNKKIQFL
jgi:hypothetical protein